MIRLFQIAFGQSSQAGLKAHRTHERFPDRRITDLGSGEEAGIKSLLPESSHGSPTIKIVFLNQITGRLSAFDPVLRIAAIFFPLIFQAALPDRKSSRLNSSHI